MTTLREQIIKLAQDRPELRKDLLPLIKQGYDPPIERALSVLQDRLPTFVGTLDNHNYWENVTKIRSAFRTLLQAQMTPDEEKRAREAFMLFVEMTKATETHLKELSGNREQILRLLEGISA